MKSLKEYIINENNFFKNLGIGLQPQIDKWLKEYAEISGTYKINKDLTIDVNGDVLMNGLKHTHEMPDYIQFNKVNGDFTLVGTEMTGVIWSLKGCPKEVTGDFKIARNKHLSSLEGCPEKIGGDFIAVFLDSLESIDNGPKEVGGNYLIARKKFKFSLSKIKKSCKKIGGLIVNDYDEYFDGDWKLKSMKNGIVKYL